MTENAPPAAVAEDPLCQGCRCFPCQCNPLPAASRSPVPVTLKVLVKTLHVAKAALENDRKFTQRHGSEDDAALNHDAIYHVEHCLASLETQLRDQSATKNAQVREKGGAR